MGKKSIFLKNFKVSAEVAMVRVWHDKRIQHKPGMATINQNAKCVAL